MRELPKEPAVKVASKLEDVLGSPLESVSAQASPAPVVRDLADRFGENPRKRAPMQGSRLGVDCSKLIEAGYYCHWVNDHDVRVQEELAKGYQFVTQDEVELSPLIGAPSTSLDNKVSRYVGTKADGSPLSAYLMKIPARWKRENDVEDQRRPDQVDRQIRQGIVKQADGDNSSRGSFYDAGTRYEQPRSR